MKQHIHILKMGGTIEFIDPAYDKINRELLKLDTSINSYLTNIIKPHFNFSLEDVCEKDSRDISEADRQKLLKLIIETPSRNVLTTHGTFTMSQTASYLNDHGLKDKVVILTGSMIPLVGFSASDAGFNLGYAISAFNYLEPGVYLAMNGEIFKAGEADKNIEELRFE